MRTLGILGRKKGPFSQEKLSTFSSDIVNVGERPTKI
jgi:hypothetical protein